MQRFSTLDHAKEAGASIDLLLELLKDLSAHARKEEQLFSSLIEPLTEDQLKSVDAAKRLGYAV